MQEAKDRKVAFVLGGGGQLGAYEVGMLRALLERDILPDVVVGTSIGALNGAAVAAEPSLAAVERLERVWRNLGQEHIFESPFRGAGTLIRKGTHVYSGEPLRRLLERMLAAKRFEDLKVPFQCVAACVERAAEHWFTEGPLVDAILASAAVPGLMPPIRVGDEHFMDGGIVNSIPIERAVHLGATELYVLHVGRIERPLEPPRTIFQVALVAFEIARRHRFARDLAALPPGVTAHVLPTGEDDPPRYDSLTQLRYRDFARVPHRIERAYRASLAYLDGVAAGEA